MTKEQYENKKVKIIEEMNKLDLTVMKKEGPLHENDLLNMAKLFRRLADLVKKAKRDGIIMWQGEI